MNQPPFDITPTILALSQRITHELGLLSGIQLPSMPIFLRKDSQIKTIQASLAIEGNTLSIEQITDLLQGKRVIAPVKDIQEVKNAIAVYERLKDWNPESIPDLLKAHHRLMQGLASDNGKFRAGGVGIFKGNKVKHVAPQANRVPQLMKQLFDFIQNDNQFSWLIKACVFHYEFVFIHPFSDGNGRMARLWQQLLLMQEHPVFELITVENLIKVNQSTYYDVLSTCDHSGKSTLFIEFSLQQLFEALKNYSATYTTTAHTSTDRLELAKNTFKTQWFCRKDYLELHKTISTSTASRDLSSGIKIKNLLKKGIGSQTCYRFS